MLIQQLRERNFILCYRGADTYGFMHRTFLEYFCAVEIVNRFEKVRSISFEELRDRVFGEHWQDETWHEVLRLICGMIDAKFAGQLIEFLMGQEVDRTLYLVHDSKNSDQVTRMSSKGVEHLLLAADCLSELQNFSLIAPIDLKLKQILYHAVEKSNASLSYEATEALLNRIAQCFRSEETFVWLKNLPVRDNDSWGLPRQAAIWTIAHHYCNHPETLEWLKSQTQEDINPGDVSGPVRWSAVRSIAEFYAGNSKILIWLKEKAQQKSDGGFVRQAAILSLAEKCKSDPEIFLLFKKLLEEDPDRHVRSAVVEAINDSFTQSPEIFELFSKVVLQDTFQRNNEQQLNPRQTALESLLTHYSTHSKTIELLRDRATNDPDEQLREWAQKQLNQLQLQENGGE